MDTETHDVAIVGGGAAGLSAALVLGRARRRVVVVDAGTPRNAPAEHMHGFLSRDGTPPAELLATARDEVRRYGVELVSGHVVDAAAGFVLRLESGRTIEARQVLLATGAVDELPDVEGARERWGRDLLHCAYCHGWEVRDQQIGVLGTGPGSVDHAHLLRRWSDDVILFTHDCPVTGGERAALTARGIRVVDGLVERLVVFDDHLEAVKLAGGPCVSRDAVFIRPALRGHSDGLAAALGCELLEGGLVRTGCDGRTTVPGVWAAGNATDPRAQVITAAGEGSAVAIAMNTELVAGDVRNAVERGARATSLP
jgi:thioredoxin reductase